MGSPTDDVYKQYLISPGEQPASEKLAAESWGWAGDNVAKPILNHLAVRPYNAAVNAVNFVGSPIGLELPKAESFKIAPAEMFSTEWVTQNASSALAMGVVFMGTSKLAGKALGFSSERVGASGALEKLMTHRSTAMISGATAYEGLRDPEHGETRLGNMAAGLTAFATFEAGGALSRGLVGPQLWGARALTGSLGMSSGLTVSTLVSRGELPTAKELATTALVGGVLNVTLAPLAARTAETPRVNGTAQYGDVPTAKPAVEFVKVPPAAAPAAPLPIAKERMMVVVGAPEKGPFLDVNDLMYRGQRYTQPMMEIFTPPNHPGSRIAIAEVRPDYARITPAQAVELVQSVPDPRLIKKLVVADGVHPEEAFAKQMLGADGANYRIHGKAGKEGDITLYRPEAGAESKYTTLHEWSHLHKMADPKASRAFEMARSMEELQTPNRGLAQGVDEPWAMLTESMLGADNMVGATTAMANPIQSSIISKSLERMLATLPEAQRSTNHQQYISMIEVVNQSVLPHAVQRLQQIAAGTDAALASRAREILKFLR